MSSIRRPVNLEFTPLHDYGNRAVGVHVPPGLTDAYIPGTDDLEKHETWLSLLARLEYVTGLSIPARTDINVIRELAEQYGLRRMSDVEHQAFFTGYTIPTIINGNRCGRKPEPGEESDDALQKRIEYVIGQPLDLGRASSLRTFWLDIAAENAGLRRHTPAEMGVKPPAAAPVVSTSDVFVSTPSHELVDAYAAFGIKI